MCGRFALTAATEDLAEFFQLVDLEPFPPRYNIAPTQPVLMITAGPARHPGSNLPDRQAFLVRWGFIPSWTRDVSQMPLMINARAETISEKASFKAAMRHRRALLPASGFYEWKREGKVSRPYWVRPRNGGIVAFASLVETYAEPGGSEIDTGAIVTTAANLEFAHIHHRMPVVIDPRDFERWLDCRTQEPRNVTDLLKPAQPDFFETIPVSDAVNKVANTGPELQERAEHKSLPEKAASKKKLADINQLDLF
ncbi:SOS response-associated peptidase [Limoniibacter endophyticus]|uniref:Abasic site processing protein n=1 Tax=Limoniibacter endophyticus TaxID=1565040 RepID=A0A8J3DGE3_9HYPH|nr:SOS response-associated peptidase [Limoniibacter endophyticus]GHC68947.1 DUF159 family protein [Limoniibacter endophyticus]